MLKENAYYSIWNTFSPCQLMFSLFRHQNNNNLIVWSKTIAWKKLLLLHISHKNKIVGSISTSCHNVVYRSYRHRNDVMCLQVLLTFIFSYAYFSDFPSSISDLLGGQRIRFFGHTVRNRVRIFRAHLLTISMKIFFSKY